MTQRRYLPVGIIILLAAVFFFPVWGLGKTYIAFDCLSFLNPWYNPSTHANNALLSDPIFHNYIDHLLFSQSIASGNMDFWRVDQLGGLSLAPSWQNPFQAVIFAFMSPLAGMMTFAWIHVLLAGLMMYAFLRQYRMRRIPALTGAAAWMFNGFVMVWLEYEFSVAFAAVLPATLFFVERWWRGGSWRDWLGVTICIAYAIAIGFPHLLIYYFLFLAAYLIWLSISRAHNFRSGENIRKVIKNAGLIVLAMGIAAISQLGFFINSLSHLTGGQRHAFSFADLYANTGQLYGRFLLTMFYPGFFTLPVMNKGFIPGTPDQCYNNFNELCVFAGFLTLALAITAIFLHCRRRTWFFIFVGAFALASSMGGIVYYPLAQWVPGLAFSTPTRILFFWGFALAVLAAAGMQVVIYVRHRKYVITVTMLCLLALAIVIPLAGNHDGICQMLMPSAYKACHGIPEWVRWTSPYIYIPLAFMVSQTALLLTALYWRRGQTVLLFVAILALAAQLMVFAMKYNTASTSAEVYPLTPGMALLQSQPKPFRVVPIGNFYDNAFSAFQLESIGGYQSIYPRRSGEFLEIAGTGSAKLSGVNTRWVKFSAFNFQLFSLANVRYLIMEPRTPTINDPRLQLIYDGEMKIYLNRMCLPRAFWAPSAARYNDEDLRKVIARSTLRNLMQQVPLEKSDTAPPILQCASATPTVNINITDYRVAGMVIHTETSDPGYLVVSNAFDPGWKVEIDGVAASLERAYYMFQAVALPSGKHEVVLYYQPNRIMTATFCGYAVWLVLLILFLAAWYGSARRKTGV